MQTIWKEMRNIARVNNLKLSYILYYMHGNLTTIDKFKQVNGYAMVIELYGKYAYV
jgi:hypothetical protein